MFDIKNHLLKIIDPANKPVILLSEAGVDPDARMFFAAESISAFAQPLLIGSVDDIRQRALASRLMPERAQAVGVEPEVLVERILQRCSMFDHLSPKYSDYREALADYCYAKLGEKTDCDRKWFSNWLRSPVPFSVAASVPVEGVGRIGHTAFGGLVTTSRDFFLPCLRLHPREGTVFTAAVFCFDPDRGPRVYRDGLLVLADVAVVNEMDTQRLADITLGTAGLAADLFHPNPLQTIDVGMLSYSTRGSGSGPSVEMVRAAYADVSQRMANMTHSKWQSVRITPEVQFAPAVLEGAAQQKLNLSEPINAAAGKCSVLIAPTLDVGNVLFHLHVAYFRGSSYVLIPAGFKWHSAVDFSRSSKVDDIVLAAAAASARIQKTPALPPVITL